MTSRSLAASRLPPVDSTCICRSTGPGPGLAEPAGGRDRPTGQGDYLTTKPQQAPPRTSKWKSRRDRRPPPARRTSHAPQPTDVITKSTPVDQV